MGRELGELLRTRQVYSICSFLFFLDIDVKGRLLFLKLKETERMKSSDKRKGKTKKTSPQSVESGAGRSGLCVQCPLSHVLLNLICYLWAAAVASEFKA